MHSCTEVDADEDGDGDEEEEEEEERQRATADGVTRGASIFDPSSKRWTAKTTTTTTTVLPGSKSASPPRSHALAPDIFGSVRPTPRSVGGNTGAAPAARERAAPPAAVFCLSVQEASSVGK